MEDSPDDPDHPQVIFREAGGGGIGLGYLAIIDGIPWLAVSLEEARSRVPATMIRLDAQLLKEQQNSDTGERGFLYRGSLPVR